MAVALELYYYLSNVKGCWVLNTLVKLHHNLLGKMSRNVHSRMSIEVESNGEYKDANTGLASISN